jgi:hypothetical protein
MLFILRLAQRGCERHLRGIQRLLCTLLCTRSNPYKKPIHLSAAHRVDTHVWLPPPMIVRPLLQKRGVRAWMH